MTDRASGSAAARCRPLARVALLALPGAVVVGVQMGVWYSLVYTLPNLLLDPASLGGSGSVGLAIFGAWIGAVAGAFFGLGVGAVTAGVVALCWLLRLPRQAVTVIGSLALACAALGLTAAAFGPDPTTLLLPLLGATQGVAGVILLTWVAEQRPHDYEDALAARETRTPSRNLGLAPRPRRD